MLTICFVAALAPLPAYNLHVDASRVLSRDVTHEYLNREGNIGFLKMVHVLESEIYDSFVFGSSRVRFGIDADYLDELTNDHWYKFDYPGGVLREHLHNLRVLVESERDVKSVLLAVDDFVLYERRNNESDYNYRLYPIGWLEWVQFYQFYLFKWPGKIERAINLGETKLVPTDRIQGERKGIDFGLDTSDARELRLLSELPQGMAYGSATPYMSEVLAELRQIKYLCNQYGIDLQVIITPRHYKTMLSRNWDVLAEFRRKMAEITEFYDFNGVIPQTLDARYWRETSHFHPEVGREISRVIFAGQSLPGGTYGKRVTRANVQSHNHAMRAEYLTALPRLLASDDRVSLHPSFLGSDLSEIPFTEISEFKVNSGVMEIASNMVQVRREASAEPLAVEFQVRPRKDGDSYLATLELAATTAGGITVWLANDRAKRFELRGGGIDRHSFFVSRSELDEPLRIEFSASVEVAKLIKLSVQPAFQQ